MDLTIVIPCKNESSNINFILSEIRSNTSKLKIKIEVILVDDYSADETWKEIERASILYSSRNFAVRGIRLGMPSGQQLAIASGYRCSIGDYVLSMDADGQHPARYISEFWMRKSNDSAIVGVQKNRRGSRIYSLIVQLFYRFLGNLSSLEIVENGGDFRLVKRELAKFIARKSTKSTVIRFLIAEKEIKCIPIFFQPDIRFSGKSSYSTRMRLELLVNSLFHSYSLTMGIGGRIFRFSTVLLMVIGIYVFYGLWFGNSIAGWSSTILIIGLMSSINFGILGLLARVISNIESEVVKGESNFIIKSIGFDAPFSWDSSFKED